MIGIKRAVSNRFSIWLWVVLSPMIYSWILLGPYGYLFENLLLRLGILTLLVAGCVILIRSRWDGLNVWVIIFASLIGYTFVYKVIGFLPKISSYPFTLSWSEGSAYYFASLFFSEKIYGIELNLPLINPTRHILMAIPFLVSGLPIWVHRLWEVVLWIGISWIAVALLVRRLNIRDNLLRWVYFAWVFIFLFQGPVYYFLLVSLIPILWGFDSKRFSRTLILVLIGSVWAGMSRVNWIPVPGLLAATLYFIEERIGDKTRSLYILKPGIFFVSGTIVALFSWYGYAVLSGNPVDQFSIYFSSTLLWYRLFPNATYSGGVLPVTLLVSAPLLGLITVRMYKSGHNYHLIRRVGIVLILLILFIEGLLVSTKIGGGSNIHNLDAYLVLLLITGSYIFFNRTPQDYNFPEREIHRRLSSILISLVVLTPVLVAWQGGNPSSLPDHEDTKNALATVQEYVQDTTKGGGKVLFIGERQLLTFDQIKGVSLIPYFERMKLMEMVMGGDEEYLNEFYRRIMNQDFALIITEPLSTIYKGRSEQFGEENDIYVRSVSEPVLCYYEPLKTIPDFAIQLLVPKAEFNNCAQSFRTQFSQQDSLVFQLFEWIFD